MLKVYATGATIKLSSANSTKQKECEIEKCRRYLKIRTTYKAL